MTPHQSDLLAAAGSYLMALGGSALYGLYMLAIRLRQAQPVTVRDLAGVALNVACAIAVGLIATALFAERLTGLIPWHELKDPGLVAFAFGTFGWELLPLMFPKALQWFAHKADEKIGS